MAQTFTSFQEFKRRYPIRPNDKEVLLGSGTYGRVIKVEDQLETEWVAIKISEFKGNDTKSLKAEVELAQRLPRQANIARYDACHRLETDTSVSDFAIMKYYQDGNLADLLHRGTLNPTQLYDITRGILLGLQHLHRHRIVHRDFKPANILISRDNAGRFIPKIADFGLSKLVSDDELDSSDFDLSDGRGTPSYKAPEQIEGSRVSFNLDLWAFGVILYEMLTGEKPFRADSRNVSEQSVRREIEKKIVTVELPTRLDTIDQPYRAMIERCLVHDIHKRVRKEGELLDLLDNISQLLIDAQKQFDQHNYEAAIALFEQVLDKRENHPKAEEGIAQCRLAIERLYITNLLNEADKYITLQQFELANTSYELVLARDAQNADAIRGRKVCLEHLRPIDQLSQEVTDIYEESTDLYVAPPKQTVANAPPTLATVIESIAVKKPGENTFSKAATTQASVTGQSAASLRTRTFPWLKTAPAVILIGGIVWYWNSHTAHSMPPTKQQEPTEQQAEIGISSNSNTARESEKLNPGPTSTSNLTVEKEKIALTNRVNVALIKARRAFSQKDYETTLMLTNSALQLDPTRDDVITLRNTALKASSKTNNTPETIASPTVVAGPESKPTVAGPTEEEKRLKAKQEQQSNYDQLIEEGIKALGSNNKAKAIATFTNAQASAKENGLSTSKGDEAYTYSLNKGKGYFDRDELDGAKERFHVAQALKDTDEVRRKIKQCTN